jgi:hypothetical protein
LSDEVYFIDVDSQCPLITSGIDTPDKEFDPGYYLYFREDVEAWVQENLSEDVVIDTNFENDEDIFRLIFHTEEDFLAFKIKWIL